MTSLFLQIGSVSFGSSGDAVDYVAIAGIAGTLIGAALGAYVTWRIQQRQLEHDDQTRFHQERLKTYAAYTEGANRLVAAMPNVTPQHNDACFRAWETLRLIGSPKVVAAAALVHVDIVKAAQGKAGDLAQFILIFNAHMNALVAAIRNEIGIEPLPAPNAAA